MSIFEYHLYELGYQNIAGIDEAGRGPLAGPVVVAACLLPKGFELIGLNDSKKLSPEKRQELYSCLVNDENIVYSVSIIDSKTIDRLNILQATLYGMKQCIQTIKEKPDYLLIDGNQAPDIDMPKETIVSGDTYSISIAAASIIAKCYRDKLMHKLHEKWPYYGFDHHKGYATKDHISALTMHGPCPIHRRSFAPVKQVMKKPCSHQLSFQDFIS